MGRRPAGKRWHDRGRKERWRTEGSGSSSGECDGSWLATAAGRRRTKTPGVEEESLMKWMRSLGLLACALLLFASRSSAQPVRTDVAWARSTVGQVITLDGV